MRKLIYIITLMPLLSFSQGQGNNWCFGDSIGLHFDSLGVVQFTSGINSSELATTISDSAGNLLLYFGGNGYSGASPYSNVWNGNHQLVLNGTLLYGTSSCTQGGVFLPFIDSTNLYYLFQLGSSSGSNPAIHLFYSIIDIAANNGTGEVILKNNLLLDSILTEKMQLIRHANGRDWWLIMHGYGNNSFYKFLISNNQISGPFVQNIGNPFGFPGAGYGQLSISKPANKIAIAGNNGIIDLFDFDRCSGLLSNWVNLGAPPYNLYNSYYGCSFSPNERFLYVSNLDSLVQFDLMASNISASRFKLFEVPSPAYLIGQHAIGPDNKIYIACGHGNGLVTDSFSTHLTVIENPNLPYNACGCSPYSFSLGGRKCRVSIPNIPNYNLGPVTGSICDSLSVSINEVLQQQEKILISPNPAKDEVFFRLPFKTLGYMSFSVFSFDGIELIRRRFQYGQNEFILDLSSFRSGVYLVKIFRNNTLVNAEKLVIIK